MILFLTLLGLWRTKVSYASGVIYLPDFGHRIPLNLLSRFLTTGSIRIIESSSGAGQLQALFEWDHGTYNYYTDDWGGAQITNKDGDIEHLFKALAQSSRTRVIEIAPTPAGDVTP